jgi:hypothetical protein
MTVFNFKASEKQGFAFNVVDEAVATVFYN